MLAADNFRINQHQRLITFFRKINHQQGFTTAHLSRGQTNTIIGGVQGVEHIIDQRLYAADIGYRAGNFPQAGVRCLQYG